MITDALSSSAKYGTDVVDRAVDVAPVDNEMILGRPSCGGMSNVRFIAHFKYSPISRLMYCAKLMHR